MDFLELVKEARTCRRFDEAAELSEECLSWLVDCARLTPCAKNQQALRYVALKSAEARAALFPCLGWAGALPDWTGPKEGERPGGYLVVCLEGGSRELARIDMGIAGQTIQLAAQSRGLAACMILSFNAEKVARVLELPEGVEPLLVIALGKPVEVRRIVPVPADGSLKYWRDEEQVHYVPKRALSDILLGIK